MVKVILKQSDIDNETDNYLKALNDSIQIHFDDFFYGGSNLDINKYIAISDIKKDYYTLKLDLPIEEKFLLSFGNEDNLDGCYFDVECLIWNTIVSDIDNEQEYNYYTVQQENLFDLFYEIEQEILSNEITVTKDLKPIDLLSLIDIDFFIDEYFKFKDDVDIDLLKDSIEQGITGLDKYIVDVLSEYLQSDDYYDFIDSIEFSEIDYIQDEINQHGFIEVYI